MEKMELERIALPLPINGKNEDGYVTSTPVLPL